MNDSRYPVACPRCNAQPGEPCRSGMGNVTLTHTSRWTAARDAGLECGSPDAKELRALNKKREPFNAFQFDADNAEEG